METKCIIQVNQEKANVDSRLPILYPVVLGAPDTSISVDTETTSASSSSESDSESECECLNDLLPINNGAHGALPPGSAIHVENSSDIVIGPQTRFHGPVTIYQTITANTQNHNGMLENNKNEEPNNATNDQHTEKNHHSKSQQCRKSICSIAVTLILVTIAVSIAVYLRTNTAVQEHIPTANETSNTPITEELTTPLNFPHHMYTRSEWGGTPPSHLVNSLIHPIVYVIISHTAGQFCNSFSKCSELVRNIQSYHMNTLTSSDIGYNFLIGNDGGIYIGRGWDIRNIHADNNIGISIIGDFVARDIMTPEMVATLKDLLELGVKLKKLAVNYRLVCHNQTFPTESPGKNVCNKVAKFPNYVPGEIEIPAI